ncbi:MAG: BON domain-containing protein [Deltaproteobacteria bacterium]|nr:BON domain-containing protein [Nannocystaceae bacterium]
MSREAAPSPGGAARPRSRAEVDNALHGIGLALDALLGGLTTNEDPAKTAMLPIGHEHEPDVHERLRALLADAALEVAELEVVASGECVVIRGRVSDPLARLWVEDLVWSLPDVQACDNRLAVGS